MAKIIKSFFDNGLVIPLGTLPLVSLWLPKLRLRLGRWDLDPSDRRVGLTLQLEW